ncbi:hypothetical protein MAQ5080_01024 [Marinomonas aquimarina]|uniref:Uncharacterized protein n=1 Tax=Marinomonas aquimarina TaxID=295068 RepID=A0A1A8T9R9_9GAMM|nr:hypothetical protein MAQ5080_01024 [Marinomonas aquimarina]
MSSHFINFAQNNVDFGAIESIKATEYNDELIFIGYAVARRPSLN